MKIYIMQHAEAKNKDEDIERSLSDVGQENAEKVSRYISKKDEIEIDKIVHSGKKRAFQTAKIISKYITDVEIIESNGLAPNDDAKIWKEKIQTMENVLLIGHLPFLKKFISFLIFNNENLSFLEFKNAGLLCLEFVDNNWKLLWYIVPKNI